MLLGDDQSIRKAYGKQRCETGYRIFEGGQSDFEVGNIIVSFEFLIKNLMFLFNFSNSVAIGRINLLAVWRRRLR